jgi:hypothetical protein
MKVFFLSLQSVDPEKLDQISELASVAGSDAMGYDASQGILVMKAKTGRQRDEVQFRFRSKRVFNRINESHESL